MGYSMSGQTDDNMSSGSHVNQTFGGINKGTSNTSIMILAGAVIVAALLLKR